MNKTLERVTRGGSIMQKQLDEANARVRVVAEYIKNGDVHHDPDWSRDLEMMYLGHGTTILEFNVEKGYTNFNGAAMAHLDMIRE